MHTAFHREDFRRELAVPGGGRRTYYSLPALQQAGFGAIARLPVSLRVILESMLRHADGFKVDEAHVRALAQWQPTAPRTQELPFVVARIVLQDYTGVPLLADLAAMRDAATAAGRDAARVEPLVPVHLVIDHSVQTTHTRTAGALERNVAEEFARNQERYQFMKWGAGAFAALEVTPPAVGIVHQVNLEHLAPGVQDRDGVLFFDSVLGTDSHTTMVNGIGVVGWGVGGIEAEAAMLGQPTSMLTPDVVGVHLRNACREGVTATDVVLTLTEILRRENVVGKIVEYFGPGAAHLGAADRATIANMAPDYGATMGYFPVDEVTLDYLLATGRTPDAVATLRAYLCAQETFGMPQLGAIDYSRVIDVDLAAIVPSVAGPRRPQDRLDLGTVGMAFADDLARPVSGGGYGRQPPVAGAVTPPQLLRDGDVVIAGITSCTNTSNPGVLIAAGLLAQKAAARGLRVRDTVKTSFAPGSRAATAYLAAAGLLEHLATLGFRPVAYGCATCIGNVGNLDAEVERQIVEGKLVAAAVLSGNRNFEARIHPAVRANYLMSPPLVVAFALAGTVRIDLTREAIGVGADGRPVYLREIWPQNDEIAALLHHARNPAIYREAYATRATTTTPWAAIAGSSTPNFAWDHASTYVARPPFMASAALQRENGAAVSGARALLILGDSVTTDHISPAGRIAADSPAGAYLQERGIRPADFNTYGARRGHHEVMVRGTFSNVRLKNRMLASGREGGFTTHHPSGVETSVHAAAALYREAGVPTLVIAGAEYGTGSSRDWAAKGTHLLGVRAVIAVSFERIHRSNLVGMGVLPCQFAQGWSGDQLALQGSETFDIVPAATSLSPRMAATLRVHRADGTVTQAPLIVRVDTPIEVHYFQQGGILPYVTRNLLAA